MRRVIEDMTKRGTVWMMALMFAASLLAAPAAMAHKTGVQGPQKGDQNGLGGFKYRKMFFHSESGGGGFGPNHGGIGSTATDTRAPRQVISEWLRLYMQLVIRR